MVSDGELAVVVPNFVVRPNRQAAVRTELGKLARSLKFKKVTVQFREQSLTLEAKRAWPVSAFNLIERTIKETVGKETP